MKATKTDSILLERTMKLLERVPLIDGHNDLAWVILNDDDALGSVERYNLRLERSGDTDIPKLRRGRVSAQVFAAFVPTDHPAPAEGTNRQIEIVNDFSRLYPDIFAPVMRAEEIVKAHAEGLIGVILSVEGTVGLEGDIERLKVWHQKGVRLVTLCHNGSLPWVDSSTGDRLAGGLSEVGRNLVRQLNRLSMIVDCSHASLEAAEQALDVSSAPIVFSHSNTKALVDSPRNVSDKVLEKIAETKSILMVTFLKDYVSEEVRQWMLAVRPKLQRRFGPDRLEILEKHAREVGKCPDATLQQVADHIEYAASIAGRHSIGIGSDFYGVPTVPVDMEDVTCFPLLLAELLRRGWSDEDVAGVAGGNFVNLFQRVEVEGARLRNLG